MERKRDPRGQGDFGELSAMFWLASQGAAVYLPISHSRDCDLIADWGEEAPVRVQVKTSAFFRRDRWEVMLRTCGGNQSWSGEVKKLDPAKYDFLFVHVGDGRRWFMPSTDVDASSHALFGGPKYARFEIEPGDPLPAYRPASGEAPDARLDRPRRGSRAVKGDAL